MQALYLMVLDRSQSSDTLFLNGLARARFTGGPRASIVVHGSDEAAVRRIEAEGQIPLWRGGELVARTAEEALLIEQAMRATTRRIVGMLTDAGVHAVGFQGAERRLLVPEGTGVAAGRTGSLLDLAEHGVLPVVASSVRDLTASIPRPVHPCFAAAALARGASAYAARVVLFTLTGRAGIQDGDRHVDEAPLFEEVISAADVDTDALAVAVDSGLPVILTSPAGLFHPDGVKATRILPRRGQKSAF
jgi:hypothetical protein